MTRAAALVGLVALGCQPIVYELGGPGTAATTTSTTEHDPTTMSPTTGSTDQPPPPPTGEPPPSCGNGGLDGLETDFDCGGPECKPCGPGSTCKLPTDCDTLMCLGGLCSAGPGCAIAEDCPQDPCRDAKCDPGSGQCVYTDLDGQQCDPGDLCSQEAVCKGGKCLAVPKDCSWLGGPCAIGFCNPASGNCAVEPIGDGQPCDGGSECAIDAFCSQGECMGKQQPPPLFDDLSLPGPWELEPPWEIGPAEPSQCAANGIDDPPEDQSVSPDNVLAGTLIGGCLGFDDPKPVEGCMTSQPIPLQQPAPLVLSFWSQLSAPMAPGGARVEVFNGFEWQPLFDTKGEPYDEAGWKMHAFDLPPEQGPELRVRFCVSSPGIGPPPVSGWSVDDIYVGPPGCQP